MSFLLFFFYALCGVRSLIAVVRRRSGEIDAVNARCSPSARCATSIHSIGVNESSCRPRRAFEGLAVVR